MVLSVVFHMINNMDNKLRMRKRREIETSEQHEVRLSRDRLNKKRKRELETDEQREVRLVKDNERHKRYKRPILKPIDEHQNRQEEFESELHSDISSNIQQLTESDHILLQNFRSEMNKLEHKSCPIVRLTKIMFRL